MASSFMGLYVQREGLNLAQKAMDVTGSNLTNAKTKGYTRQLLDMTSVQTHHGTLGYKDQIYLAGAGVDGTGVTQVRDEIADDKYRVYNGIVEKFSLQSNVLSYVEDAIDDIENDQTGFAHTLQEFKAAWQAFSSSGTDQTDLANVAKNKAQCVIDVLKNFNYRIDTISEDVIDDTKASVKRVNSILRECAALNEEIKSGYVLMDNFYQTGYYDGDGMDYQADTNYGPLEIKDKMNSLIDELSGYMDVKSRVETDGTYTIWVSGQDAVVGNTYSKLTYVQEFAESDYSKLISDLKQKVEDKDYAAASDAIDAYMADNLEDNKALEGLKIALGGGNDDLISAALVKVEETGFNNRYSGEEIAPTELAFEMSILQTDKKWTTAYNQIEELLKDDPDNKVLLDMRDSLQSGDFNKARNIERQYSDKFPAKYKPIFRSNDITEEVTEGRLKGELDVFNGAGVYAKDHTNDVTLINHYANGTKGIEFYRQTMNELAKSVHNEFNGIYKNKTDKNGNPIDFKIFDFDVKEDGTLDMTTYGLKLSDDFSATPIKAVHPEGDGNYTDEELSNEWVNRITSVFEAKHQIGLESEKYTFEDFVNYYDNAIGSDIGTINQLRDSERIMLNTISDERDAKMGVSTDEEGVNMLVYQKWFNAMGRMTTALDQLLDKLINNTGIVGL